MEKKFKKIHPRGKRKRLLTNEGKVAAAIAIVSLAMLLAAWVM